MLRSNAGIDSRDCYGISRVAVVVVTHNSSSYLDRCIQSVLNQQETVLSIVIVDNASANVDYLVKYAGHPKIKILFESNNMGFSKANNLGIKKVLEASDYVLLLNPDAFVTQGFIRRAKAFMDHYPATGVVTGKLLGFDIARAQASGLYDSTGIFRKWYGKWYDRGQGQQEGSGLFDSIENVPAICGALMFFRGRALQDVIDRYGEVFDSKMFMYKEDIDLCLRVKKLGWALVYNPELVAHHCRGWSKKRQEVSKEYRIMSARNEVRLCARSFSPFLVYALVKLVYVKWLEE